MKKILAIIMAVICVLSFASCKKDVTEDTAGSAIKNEQVPEKNEEQAPLEEPEVNEETNSEETTKPEETEKPQETPKEETPVVSTPSTVGNTLLSTFKSKASSGNALTVAEAILADPTIAFMGASMEVEPGFLNGFNDEITGFSEGAMFGPMIGTIPFVGYVFTISDTKNVASFIDTLKASANLRWNICTEAEEMVVGSSGNKVFFVMCPKSFDEE